jgi:hypothetical protein
MNKSVKRVLVGLFVAGMGMVLLAAGIHAAEECSAPDVITMKNEKAFPQHRMGIVEFDHKTHAEEYDLTCGRCHHDENGKPLTGLKDGDPVQECIACHDKPGRPRRDQSMSPEEWQTEQLKYYYGAIHENCMGCHKEKGGPTRCTECHPRPQQ